MKIDFDTENIRKHEISLMDCQIDLILRSLEFYLYTYRFIYPRRGKTETVEEDLRKSIVFDTYQQIRADYNESRAKNPIVSNLKILDELEGENSKKKNKSKIA